MSRRLLGGKREEEPHSRREQLGRAGGETKEGRLTKCKLVKSGWHGVCQQGWACGGSFLCAFSSRARVSVEEEA